MRILFLTQVLPYPLDAGPKARAYHVLRHLASRGHALTLVSFVRETDRPEDIECLKRFCRSVQTVKMHRSRTRDAWELLRSLALGKPFLVTRDWIPEMAAKIRSILDAERPFDVIHADQLWMAPYALMARRASADVRPPAAILDQHNAVFQIPQRLADAESNLFKKILLRLEADKMARFEASACRQFNQVVWVTEQDRQALNALTAAVGDVPKGTVIPISIDTAEERVINRRPDARRVTFLGGLHWPPNRQGVLWFKNRVWPSIAAKVPDAVFTVIGKDPPVQVASAEKVEIRGYVEDPAPLLAETAVFVIPLLAGGGMRVKLLDAWSWGLPVVSTRIGAEGILVEDGRDALIADQPEAFANAAVRLLREPSLAELLARNGRAKAERLYDWRRAYGAWDQVYQCAYSSSSPTRPV